MIKSCWFLLPIKTAQLRNSKIAVSKIGLCQKQQTEIKAVIPKTRPLTTNRNKRSADVALTTGVSRNIAFIL